jgi:hypothetical protein
MMEVNELITEQADAQAMALTRPLGDTSAALNEMGLMMYTLPKTTSQELLWKASIL